jgi:hypothetical protein
MTVWKKAIAAMRSIWYRIYSDFFMPSRLGIYERLLVEALNHEYEVHSIESYWELLKTGRQRSGQRYLILRHDVDTDVKTARAMWEIEKRLGVKASYYFRLTTLDVPFMREIHESGGEASYHYEEIAAVGKKRGLATKAQVYACMPIIREHFKENLVALRKKTGLPLHIVASHGDFFNRKVGMINHEILQDVPLRKELGIELETYDDVMMRHVTSRHSDTLAPLFWKPSDPVDAIRRGEPVVYVLTHPRHWRSDFMGNLKNNFKRVGEEICYQIRKRFSHSVLLFEISIPISLEKEWLNAFGMFISVC